MEDAECVSDYDGAAFRQQATVLYCDSDKEMLPENGHTPENSYESEFKEDNRTGEGIILENGTKPDTEYVQPLEHSKVPSCAQGVEPDDTEEPLPDYPATPVLDTTSEHQSCPGNSSLSEYSPETVSGSTSPTPELAQDTSSENTHNHSAVPEPLPEFVPDISNLPDYPLEVVADNSPEYTPEAFEDSSPDYIPGVVEDDSQENPPNVVSEESVEYTPEAVVDSSPDYVPEVVEDDSQEYPLEAVADNSLKYPPEIVADSSPEYQPEANEYRSSEFTPEAVTDNSPEYPLEVAVDNLPEYPPEVVTDNLPEYPPEVVTDSLPEYPPEVVTDNLPEYPIEVVLDNSPEYPPEEEGEYPLVDVTNNTPSPAYPPHQVEDIAPPQVYEPDLKPEKTESPRPPVPLSDNLSTSVNQYEVVPEYISDSENVSAPTNSSLLPPGPSNTPPDTTDPILDNVPAPGYSLYQAPVMERSIKSDDSSKSTQQTQGAPDCPPMADIQTLPENPSDPQPDSPPEESQNHFTEKPSISMDSTKASNMQRENNILVNDAAQIEDGDAKISPTEDNKNLTEIDENTEADDHLSQESGYKTTKTEEMSIVVEHGESRSDKCSDRVLHCLSQVPCASLIAWIILLMGLGGITGSLLIGVQKTRDLLESDQMLWFTEYTLIGVVVGMFLIGTALLCVGHISTDPTSRHLFHTTKRNSCAQGLNIFMLVISYMLGVAWTVVTSILGIPLFLLLVLIIIKDEVTCINLVNYGLSSKEFCDRNLTDFARQGQDLMISYIVAYVSSVLITVSLIHFMIVISANLAHLKDRRLATLNAYVETAEEAGNSKHSIVDTTM